MMKYLLLYPDRKRHTVNTQFGCIYERRDALSHNCNCRPDIKSSAKANREGGLTGMHLQREGNVVCKLLRAWLISGRGRQRRLICERWAVMQGKSRHGVDLRTMP